MATTTSTVSSQFSGADRARGLDYVLEHRIVISSLGEKGVFGRATNRAKDEMNHVGLDLCRIESGQLGCYCSCKQFRDVGSCEHLFALIRHTESQVGRELADRDLWLVRCRPSDIAFGRRIDVVQASSLPSTSTHWSNVLAKIKQIHKEQQRSRSVPNLCGPTDRLLYILDISSLIELERFYFNLVLEKQSTGEGKEYQRILLSPGQIERFGAEDQHLLTLLTADLRTHLSHRALSQPDHGLSDACSSQRYGTSDDYYDQLTEEDDDFDFGYDDDYEEDDDQRLVLTLSTAIAAKTLKALTRSGRLLWTMDLHAPELYQSLAWDDAAWQFVLQVKAEARGAYSVVGMLRSTGAAQQAAEKPNYRSLDDVVAVCETGAVLFEHALTVISPRDALLLRTCREQGTMKIGSDELDAFLSRIVDVLPLEQLELPKKLNTSTVIGEPRCRVLLSLSSHSDHRLDLNIELSYGEVVLEDQSELQSLWDPDNRTFIVRNLDREEELKSTVQAHPAVGNSFIIESRGGWIHRKQLSELVADLMERGIEVYADGKLQRCGGSYSLSVSSGEDWFDLDSEVTIGGTPVPFPTLLAAIRSGRKTVRLDDGSEGILPDEWLNKFRGMSELGTEEDGKLRFRPSQALLLDSWLDKQPAKLDRDFKRWVRKLNGFNGIKAQQEPVTFEGELREYQRDGLGWFKFLEEFRFGGCLADDMGLGKTIQVLALLERRRLQQIALREKVKPSIAIVPKSLVYNWVAEAAKFAPELKVVDYTGPQRRELVESLQDANLIVTTYATFRLDVEGLKEIEFDYAILDEAQAIKNPNCQATKAVRLIQSNFRLAMTGTPIENHLGDLWSILNFLNPGMLGSLKPTYFSRSGDEAEGNDRLQTLSRALKPFILRRTKSQVLTELPEKTEQILYCEMTSRQRKQYEELRKYYAQNLQQTVAKVGLNKAKIQVLEALLRLRQVACDPRLVSPKERAIGAKIPLLVEQIEEVMEDGHKALVFSQFTSMLALVRKELDKRKWRYEYLDGSSTKRGASVKRFQEDPDCQLFLISLKAGGHGLNLTAADYVYILDPWWNPAVEAQAVDRAHRMGQKNSVMAYRLITRDSVEEKIANMQESKKKLAEAVISSDQSLLRSLSMDDLRVLFE